MPHTDPAPTPPAAGQRREFFDGAATFDRAQADSQARTVPVSLSSEHPVRRFGELEVLRHDAASIDLQRAEGGLPLLFGHDRMAPIGVVENVRLQGRRLVGVARFGSSARAAEVWADVVDGVLRHVSISYAVLTVRTIEGGYEVTRWEPFEASVVSVPADPSVGIGRDAPAPTTTTPTTPASGAPAMPATTTTTTPTTTSTPDHAERERAAAITALCARHGAPASLTEQLIRDGRTPEQAGLAILEQRGQEDRAAGGHINVSGDQRLPLGVAWGHGPQQRDAAVEAMTAALVSRCGGPAPAADNAYRGARLADMARDCLELRGVRTMGMNGHQLVERALHTTSDFAALLTQTGDRTLRAAYSAYTGGVRRAFRQSSARDFRAKSRLMLGEAPALKKVLEHGEFTYGSMGESKSSYSLSTFGRIFGITRQALVNDDLDAFADMTGRLGRAAAEFEATFLVDLLLSNPTMAEDGTPLFDAAHANLGSGGGSALSVTSLSAGRKALRLMKGLDGATPIDAAPAFLIVPAALETTAEQLIATLSPTVATEVNPFSGRLELVVDPRLDAASATAWYLAASPGTIDTIEYAYLEGEEGPQVTMREGFTIDGVEFKVRLDFGAGVLDWRGMYKSVGA